MFLFSLELHPRRLWQLRRAIFGLGLAQVVVTGLILTGLIFVTLGFSPAAALALGLPLALSSTAQVLPSLKSSGRINSPFGEKAFSILLFQDLAIVPMITIIAALSRAPADPSAPPGTLLALYTLLAIAGLVLAGRFVVNPLLRLVARCRTRSVAEPHWDQSDQERDEGHDCVHAKPLDRTCDRSGVVRCGVHMLTPT